MYYAGEVTRSDFSKTCSEQGPQIFVIGGGIIAQHHESICSLLDPSHIKLIALLDMKDDLCALKTLILEFAGGLLTTEVDETIAHVVRAVSGGHTCFSKGILQYLFPKNNNALIQRIQYKYTSLSSNEQEILYYIVLGWNNGQIGQKLGFAEQTVRNYVKNIYTKIGVNNRALLVSQIYQQLYCN